MLDYIALQEYVTEHPDQDEVIASEIEKAEEDGSGVLVPYRLGEV